MPFQFSIGDADVCLTALIGLGRVMFQFSIGDAEQHSRQHLRQIHRFQFSIGDAVAVRKPGRLGEEHVCFNSLLEMRNGAVCAGQIRARQQFQFSIGDAKR